MERSDLKAGAQVRCATKVRGVKSGRLVGDLVQSRLELTIHHSPDPAASLAIWPLVDLHDEF